MTKSNRSSGGGEARRKIIVKTAKTYTMKRTKTNTMRRKAASVYAQEEWKNKVVVA